MARALTLAARGRGTASPNPMVGAVIVRGGRIVGQGFHRRPGTPHAEILALEAAGRLARGATLYVTLEPCCHTAKRTPPCVPAVLAAGFRRIVVAMRDPNPRVRGRGIAALRRAGARVTVGVLEDQAARLNEAYVHWATTGRPFVILKAAMTLDGRIASATGESQWISGEPARREVHHLRREVDAIMVGIGTVLADDPRLTARVGSSPGRQPARVVLDSRLRLPLTARMLTEKGGETIVATTARASLARVKALEALGATVLRLPAAQGRVSLNACLAALGRRGITSVLLEGGSELNAAAVRAGYVNRLRLYIAPKLLGGRDAKGLLGGESPSKLARAVAVKHLTVTRIGDDLRIDAFLI
ncbi:bifunctional diaminohydroxyphosphoribosylaminopyrimidine deaminase/5-amino-6-(5-phosphoribosylamino)uracil reductase RibD [Candidatus Nitrospira bockiana]